MKNEELIFLDSEAKRIISLLKSDFRLPGGELCLERYGDEIFPHHIFPDLGDFLPFFLYFSEENFVDEQIELYKKTLMDGYLVSEFPSFHISGLVKSYEYSDLLFGLFDYNSVKKTKESMKLLKDTSDLAIRTFNFDRKIKSFFHSKSKLNLPILDTRDGTFIEFYVDLYKLVREEKYKEVAYNIYENLIESDYFKENGLLAIFDVGVLPKLLFKVFGINKHKIVNICKNNSNSLFGMLALYSITKDEKILSTMDSIISKIENKLIIDGGVAEDYSENKGASVSSLTSSFPVIDFLCDLFNETKNKKYLNLAERIADFWISQQGKTGLFPLKANGKESFFDSETDMCVALFKIFELTGNRKYKDSMDKCFNGIMEYHAKNDYVLGVHIDTGEVLNITQRTKFIALFLKLLILKIKKIEGVNIYEDRSLWSLLRDR